MPSDHSSRSQDGVATLFTSQTQLTPLSESQACLKPLPCGLGASVTQLRRMLVMIALADDKSIGQGEIWLGTVVRSFVQSPKC